MDKVDFTEKFALFSDRWSPKIVGEVNDAHVKIAKVQGAFVWHVHADEDEMFIIHRGRLTIRLRDRDVTLDPGQFFIVPRGVEHLPVAEEECEIIMLEPKTTLNTGDVVNERTVAEPEWI